MLFAKIKATLAAVRDLASGVIRPRATPDRREVERRVAAHLRSHPGMSQREILDATYEILTDYYLEQQRLGRKVVM